MEKRMNKIEGSPASQIIQLMRKHGRNKDITIEVGTVVSPSPSLSVNVDGIVLDSDDLIVSQTVADRGLAMGDAVIVISDDDTQFYFVIDKAVI
ncbi:DUF2577 family protein [Peribacillus simplex]|uniref:DUF2577 family protein n=2 Tax=Peribacillus TaxID=2675229 RepID=UPI0038640CB1